MAWAVVGLVVAHGSGAPAGVGAGLLLVAASVMFPLAAAGASVALAAGRDRAAGFLLLASVATPTYFAWVLNVPALVVGLALLVCHEPSRGTTPRCTAGRPDDRCTDGSLHGREAASAGTVALAVAAVVAMIATTTDDVIALGIRAGGSSRRL